jgi:outer membrane immunogenic protein
MKVAQYLLVGMLAASSSAYAADLPTRKSEPMAPPPAPFSWTGFYVGVYAGGSFGNTNMQEFNGPGELAFLPGAITSTNINPNAFVGGGFVGYNYEFPSSIVLGGEVEGGGSTASATGATYSGVHPGPAVLDHIPTYNKLTEPWNFRARARLGWASGMLLPFIAGGLSVTQENLDLTFPCPNFPAPGVTTYTANTSKTLVGFNIGAGIDWAITPNIIARAEYIFDDYGSPTFNEDGTQGWNNRKLSNLENNTGRVALAYKF